MTSSSRASRSSFSLTVDRGAAAAIHGLELNGPDSRSPDHRDVEFGPSPDPPLVSVVMTGAICLALKIFMEVDPATIKYVWFVCGFIVFLYLLVTDPKVGVE